MDLTGRTALITGATRGIGLAIARTFYEAGASLIITGTSEQALKQVAADFSPSATQSILPMAVDYCDASEFEAFLEQLKQQNRIDICVNNAGTNHIKPIAGVRPEEITALHQVNLHAPMLILGVVLEKMKTEQWGRVLNVGSLWSQLSRAGRALYTTAKHGLHGLTVTASLEYGKANILVNTLSPGFVMTDLTQRTMSAEEIAKIEARIPLGKLAQPEDIAAAALFLCSDNNRYITGQNITIDGGYICE